MAINVKCQSCGEIYNELTHSQCPNCGCEQIVRLKYEEGELVDDVDTTIKNDYCSESSLNNQEEDDNYTPRTPFVFTEVPIIFSSVYEYFFKKDKEIKYGRLILIVLIELLIGLALAAIGYYISLAFEERTHRLGISSRGGSRGGAMFMFMGVAAIAHSFYSIVKYTFLYYIGKMKVQKSEQWIRTVLFFIEIALGAIFISIGVYLNTANDTTGVLLILGAGLVVGAIWSLIKYFSHKHKTE